MAHHVMRSESVAHGGARAAAAALLRTIGGRRSPGTTATDECACTHSVAPSRRSRTRAGAFVAAAALGALAVPAAASAVVLPPAPAAGVHMPPVDRAITVFPKRDFVSATGYTKDELATVEVFRNGVLIGRSPDIVPAGDPNASVFEGLVEVNHVGAACWGGAGSPNVTPDILEGDVVRVTATTNEEDPSLRTVTTVDQTVTANVKAQKAESPTPGTVVVHGSAQDDAGNRIAIDQLELRIIGTSANRFAINSKRDIRAISGTGGQGRLSYDADGSTNWTATFTLSAADVNRAMAGDVAAAWLGAAPGAGVEGTIYEPSEIPGPGSPECPALAANGVTSSAPQAVNLAFVNGSSDLTLSGVAQADASAVSITLTDTAGTAVTAAADLSPGATGKTWTATIARGDIADKLRDGTLTASAIYTVAAPDPDPAAPQTADIAGTTLSITKDTAAPATPLATPGPGLYNKDQSVALTAEAGATIHYTTDGSTATGASRAYTAPIAVTASQTISALAVDKAGNAGPAMSYAYDIDKVAPTTTDNVSNKPLPANTPVQLTSTDDGSGVNVTYYTTDGRDPAALAPGARTAYNPDQPPVLANGERIRYFSVDKAGNAEATKTSLFAANVDSAAPASKDDVGAGFSATDVQATLSADDGVAGSGVKTIRYAIDADPTGPAGQAYTGPVTLTDGQSVWYYAEDAVGNVERPFHKSVAAKVDKTAPTTIDNVNGVTVYPADVTVALAADDGNGSGVAKTWWTTDNSNPANPLNPDRHDLATSRPVLGDGQFVKYYSIDKVGNSEGVKTSATAHVDAVAPTTNDDVPAAFVATGVAVTLTAADNAGGSGVAATWYTLDETDPTMPGTRQQYSGAPADKPVLADGGRIRYASVDRLGHWEAPVLSRAARVDATAPQTTDNVPSAVQPRAVTVTLSTTDKSDSGAAGSGVAATWYTLNGTDPTKASNTARVKYDPTAKPVLDDGQRITYASVDALGNTEIVNQSAIVTVRVPAQTQTQSTAVTGGSTAATTTPAGPSAPAPAAVVPVAPAPPAAIPALRPAGVRLASSFGAQSAQRTGVPVTVNVPAGAKVVEIQVVQLGGAQAARAAAAGRKVLATVRRSASGAKGAMTIRLDSPALRRKLKPGTYELRIRVGRSKSTLGATTTKRFRIHR